MRRREGDVEDHDVRAKTGRDLGGVDPDHAAADDHHLAGRHAGHPAEQDAAAAEHAFQVLGAFLHRHPSRHLGHGREQRQLPARKLHGLVGDRDRARAEHGARELEVGGEVEVGVDELPFRGSGGTPTCVVSFTCHDHLLATLHTSAG